MSLFDELKRRNVFRVGIAYVVMAWLTIQVADVVLNNIEAPEWVFKAIMLVLAIALPIILLFAWAFELTPDGIKREKDVDRDESITAHTGRKLDRTIIVVLALALSYFAWDKFSGPETAQVAGEGSPGQALEPVPGTKSIAVLPLANRSNREEDQFFTDGIHDDLLTQLAKVADLKVISRTSVMRYRDTELPIPEIAQQLGVTTILEGGIQRAGEQVRINMQLIEAENDKHLWAETYDRRLTAENLFAIQSEITRAITSALKATLTPEEVARIETRPTKNLEAFQELMRGQQMLDTRQVQAMKEGKGHFERALELDPQYSAAMAGLANAHHLLNEYADVPEDQSIIPAMGWLARALDIDPNLGEAYMVRGELYRHQRNWEASEADFLKAIELSPGNATAYHWFSNLKSQQGFEDESVRLLRKAHELNPMSRIIHVNLAMVTFDSGDDEAVLNELRRVQELHPDFYVAHLYEARIHSNHGDILGSLRSHLKALELDPRTNRSGFHCFDYFNLGAMEAAGNCAEDFQGMGSHGHAFIEVMLALSAGDPGKAMGVFDKSFDSQSQRWWRTSAAMLLERYEIAAPGYEEQFPAWFGEGTLTPVSPEDVDDAVDAAAILAANGHRERAHELLIQALETMAGMSRNRGRYAFGYLDVVAHALLGNREAAILAVEEAANEAYLSGWQMLKFHPLLELTRNDPRFDAAISKLELAAAQARKQAVAEGLL